jgi:hypothetical protein
MSKNNSLFADKTTEHSRDNGRMKERGGSRKLPDAIGPGCYAEGSPNQVRARMKAAGTWRGDFKDTRG